MLRWGRVLGSFGSTLCCLIRTDFDRLKAQAARGGCCILSVILLCVGSHKLQHSHKRGYGAVYRGIDVEKT